MMQGIIQVAIGMIFIYSLLSILVTTLNTVIANFLRWRAKHLKTAIETLITDPEVQAQFLSHPLINIVRTEMVRPQEVSTRDTAEMVAQEVRSSEVNPVDYIDPKTFAQVLSSLLAEKASLELYGPLLLAVDDLPESPAKQQLLSLVYRMQNTGAGMKELRDAIDALPADAQGTVHQALKPLEERLEVAQLSNTSGGQLLPVLEGLRNVNDEAFRRALKVVVASAHDIDEAQKNLSIWFDQRMDQLTDAYKRHVTYLTLAIGLLLAVLLNADSLQMARALWNDPTLRDTVVAAVQGAAASGQLAQLSEQLQQGQQAQQSALENQPGAEATETPDGSSNNNNTNTAQVLTDATAQITGALNQLTALNLPIGWEFTPIHKGCVGVGNLPADCNTPTSQGVSLLVRCFAPDNSLTECDSQRNLWLLGPSNNPNWFGQLILKIVGMAVTVIAIGQGAPFWFDLLRRLVNPTQQSSTPNT